MRKGSRSTVLPASLEQLRRRFESWRQQREKGARIPDERLEFHQAKSGPLMQELHRYLTAQLEENRVGGIESTPRRLSASFISGSA